MSPLPHCRADRLDVLRRGLRLWTDDRVGPWHFASGHTSHDADNSAPDLRQAVAGRRRIRPRQACVRRWDASRAYAAPRSDSTERAIRNASGRDRLTKAAAGICDKRKGLRQSRTSPALLGTTDSLPIWEITRIAAELFASLPGRRQACGSTERMSPLEWRHRCTPRPHE